MMSGHDRDRDELCLLPRPDGRADERDCGRRDGERGAWAELWALNHLVSGISLNGVVYTIAVMPRSRGYQIVQFRRPDLLGAARARLRFVDDRGQILAEWLEGEPSVFVPVP